MRALAEQIREIVVQPHVAAFDKRRRVAEIVTRRLRDLGHFYRTRDGRLYYFYRSDHRLYDLEQRSFEYLLAEITGLGPGEAVFKFLREKLIVATARQPEEAEVHALAHFNVKTGLLAISDGGGGMWLRKRHGQWTVTNNGNRGLLFVTDSDAEPFQPDFQGGEQDLNWFLAQFLFADHPPLTKNDQRILLRTYLYQLFFPSLRATRVIAAFLGPQGSGKTTAERLIGRLVIGPRFEVTGLRRDKQDAFVAAVTGSVVCGLDNADSRISWLEDALATYATGERYRLRRYYTTNEEVDYEPRAILMLSSRDPQFNRPDVAERLLPFYFARPENYRSEPSLFNEMQGRRNRVMGAIMNELGWIADSMNEVAEPELPFRMADFGAFGYRLFAAQGKAREWVELLERVQQEQAVFASEGDGTVESLRIVLAENHGRIGPVAVAELFDKCRRVALHAGFAFPEDVHGFGRRVTGLARMIELELNVRFIQETGHAGRRMISLIPRSGEAGGDGDDILHDHKKSASI